jgi:hypothetical protein
VSTRSENSAASLLPLVGALLLPVPWIAFALQGFHGSPLLVGALSGAAILGAAFLLSWAAELIQMDVSQALALAMLALIAVLPEYAVDAVFAFQAGRDPVVAQAGYAVGLGPLLDPTRRGAIRRWPGHVHQALHHPRVAEPVPAAAEID